MRSLACALVLTFAAVLSARAEARLALGSPFVRGAVLQREKPVPVWGWASPGDDVTVTFAGQMKTVRAGSDGAWHVTLDPLTASKEPRTLTVTAQPSSSVERPKLAKPSELSIADVVVGEVWLCSGQSNMEFSLCSGAARVRDRDGFLTAQMTDRPFVRYLNASAYTAAARPQTRTAGRRFWERLTPQMLRRHGQSAVGVYYALELYAALDVPVGILVAAWGGTSIAPWTPREGLVGKPDLADVLAHVPAADAPDGKTLAGQPTAIYNALVAPLAPYALRGIVWYQGESDRRDGTRYARKMQAYFDGMRQVFGDAGLKLYFCQIAPWRHGGPGSFDVRCQQAAFAHAESNAEMVVTADLGNPDEIHPYEKAAVAKRLAAFALRNDYGWKDLACDFPAPVSATATGAVVSVRFAHGEGLALYNLTGRFDLNVELAGADGVWHPARLVEHPKAPLFAFPDGVLRVTAEGVPAPTRIRYLFDSGAFGALVNGIGLPAGPFERPVTAN